MATPMKTLTIQEVSDRAGISKHTLRFWEREVNGVIVPLRTKGGQRRYTLEHVLVVEEIKRLKGKGYSLDDIKRDLNRRSNTGAEHYDHQPEPTCWPTKSRKWSELPSSASWKIKPRNDNNNRLPSRAGR